MVCAANTVDCSDGLVCYNINDKGMADAVGQDGILGAAEKELVAKAEDDTVIAIIGDRQDLCYNQVRGFDNVDLAVRVNATF